MNERERKFVEVYMTCGNATKAAIAAGYSKKTARVQGSRLLSKAAIKAAVNSRVTEDPQIADRTARQRFWSDVMLGREGYRQADLRDRLKASELLGKSQMDFTPRDEEGKPLPLEIRLTDDAATPSDAE